MNNFEWGKPENPKLEEWIGIIFFILIMLITLDFNFGFLGMLIGFGLGVLMKYGRKN